MLKFILFIFRDVSEQLQDSMSNLDQAEVLLDSCENQKDGDVLWYRFKMLYYKGDTNISLGNYSASR